jgi:hypothetical protein
VRVRGPLVSSSHYQLPELVQAASRMTSSLRRHYLLPSGPEESAKRYDVQSMRGLAAFRAGRSPSRSASRRGRPRKHRAKPSPNALGQPPTAVLHFAATSKRHTSISLANGLHLLTAVLGPVGATLVKQGHDFDEAQGYAKALAEERRVVFAPPSIPTSSSAERPGCWKWFAQRHLSTSSMCRSASDPASAGRSARATCSASRPRSLASEHGRSGLRPVSRGRPSGVDKSSRHVRRWNGDARARSAGFCDQFSPGSHGSRRSRTRRLAMLFALTGRKLTIWRNHTAERLS